MTHRIYLYDTTLRDGAQTRGVNLSVKDKQRIAGWLDRLGMAYVEGGWPGANPTDDEFFSKPALLKNAAFTAFGMTCRPGRKASEDAALRTLVDSTADAVCLVGKTWDFHVTGALGTTLDENLRMIRESLSFIVERGKEAVFDAEHFFDGFKANESYALDCLRAAQEGGARWIVLCDTNGGTLPFEVEEVVGRVRAALPDVRLGIHCHDDTGNAVANSLAAVKAGCEMVQGTLNGLGERCGNANLVSLIPTLRFKMGCDLGISDEALAGLTKTSRDFATLLDRDLPSNAPYVGASAFAHKGGLHVSAIVKDPKYYEHLSPELVGNARDIIVSNQAGMSNLRRELADLGIEVGDGDPALGRLLAEVKERSQKGFAYDHALGSFALLSLKTLGRLPTFFVLENCAIHNIGSGGGDHDLDMTSYASVKVRIGERALDSVAEGNGPVNALDAALRKALVESFPVIGNIRLSDYHVRILDTRSATAATTRVLLESENTEDGTTWTTVGMSGNIINASLQALCDSYAYGILRAQKA